MGRANDIMSSFFAAYPHAKRGELSMDELNELMAEYQKKLNSEGLEDFDGLSPDQMTGLLYYPFEMGSIMQFRADLDRDVDEAPFFKLSEILLNEIKRAGKVKLTQKGNLPMSICKLLVDQKLISWTFMDYAKRITEDEIPYLWPLKQYILDEGIAKKRNNFLSLTKKGEKLLEGPKSLRFIQIFRYLTNRFHWGNFHGLDDGGKSGQLGWAYSLALLAKYGDQGLPSEFYSHKLMRAFEKELWDDNRTGVEARDYHYAYKARFFDSFAHWFGLVNIERIRNPNSYYYENLIITKSELFDKLFDVKDF